MSNDSLNLSHATPARVLGPLDATCVVIGAIIGVGIFFTPSSIARLVESPSMAMLAWGIGGLIALCGAVVFAELGGMYHTSGAQYAVLRDAYGRFPSFLFVFCNATAVEAGSIGVMAVICAQNLAAAFGLESQNSFLVMSMALVLIAGLTIANIVGVRWGARIQNLTVYAKILTLLSVTLLAVFFAPDDNASLGNSLAQSATSPEAKPGAVLALLAALGPALFSYGGWQQALWVAGEIREPRRNLPRSIIVGVVIVVAVYLLVNWAYLELLGMKGVAASQSLPADAAAAALPSWSGAVRHIVAAAVALSALGVLNVQLMTGPRLIYALADDGLFFKSFATVHTKFRTPMLAIALLTGLSIALLLGAGDANRVDRLITGVVFVDGIFLAMTAIALLVLRWRGRVPEGSIRLPGSTLAVFLFALGELGLIVGACLRIPAVIGAGWIAAAAVIYLVALRPSKNESRD